MNENSALDVSGELKDKVEDIQAKISQLKAEIAKAIVGHHDIIEGIYELVFLF